MIPRPCLTLLAVLWLVALAPRMLAQNNCGYGSAALVSDNVQGAPYTIPCTTDESSNSETVTWSVEGTFIQSGYTSSIYWGPNNNAVTGHGTCAVVSGTQVNCNAKMTYDFIQTNSPTANSQFDNIAQDEINALPTSGCVVGVARVVTSYVPGFACKTSGCNPDHCGCGGSPIIIDTTGEGFQLTSEKDGVHFDIAGDGVKVQLSWTAAGSHNAFLALDRGNGITSGKDLFDNYTPQPKSDDPNGYLALAVFDLPENGGNGNGVIDPGDAVYSKLLLWIDENHDGIAQPNELHHLPELGVYSLSLKYADSPYTDEFGNQFRYKGKVNPLGQPLRDNVDRTSYDVFFVMGKVGGGTNGEVCSTGRPFRGKAPAEWERQVSEGPAPSSFPAAKAPVLAANR